MSFSIKLGLLGDPAAGKTSLGRKYVDDTFTEEYLPTIGLDVYFKEYQFRNYTCNCAFWDMSGYAAFANLRLQYLKGMNGAAVLFDTNRAFTVDGNILPWIVELIEMQIQENLPLAIIGNKSDLEAFEQINETEMIDKLAKQIKTNKIKYFSTSALTGQNVDEAFSWLIEQAILSI